MPSSTPKYALPYTLAADAVNQEPVTMKALADRIDLLLGESGAFTQSGTAGVTLSQAISLARTYPGNNAAANPGTVILVQNQTLSASTGFSFWINGWTGSGTTITGFTINVQFSGVWSSRNFLWRFLPNL